MHPSRDCGSKWWHVPDGQIEDMIRKLNEPPEVPKVGKLHGSALRDRSASVASSGSVHFNFSEPREDALDQFFNSQAGSAHGVVGHDNREPRSRVKGAWKVPDSQLLEFIQSAKTVLATEAEQTTTMLEANTVSAGRTSLGNAGGGVLTGQYVPSCANRSLGGNRQAGHGAAPPSSVRSRNSRASVAKDLSTRPAWVKSESMPNLFGVPPRGTRILKAGTCKFEETPIYLSDSKDSCMERVRVSVCGHPYYM